MTRERSVNAMPTQRSVSQMRYDKQSSRHYGMKLNMKTDADIIEILNSKASKSGYIKELIRLDYLRDNSVD